MHEYGSYPTNEGTWVAPDSGELAARYTSPEGNIEQSVDFAPRPEELDQQIKIDQLMHYFEQNPNGIMYMVDINQHLRLPGVFVSGAQDYVRYIGNEKNRSIKVNYPSGFGNITDSSIRIVYKREGLGKVEPIAYCLDSKLEATLEELNKKISENNYFAA